MTEIKVCFICGSVILQDEQDKHLLTHGIKKMPIPKEGKVMDIYGNER